MCDPEWETRAGGRGRTGAFRFGQFAGVSGEHGITRLQ